MKVTPAREWPFLWAARGWIIRCAPRTRPCFFLFLPHRLAPKGAVDMNDILSGLSRLLWGWGTITLVLGSGAFLMLRTRFLPLRRLPEAVRMALSPAAREKKGGVSPFAALMTALSATIGTGNIVGVATALVSGGVGALVWMELAAVLGLAAKFSECLLSVKYRRRDEEGRWIGGPMYVMEEKLGLPGRPLGILFSLAAVLVALSMGSMAQSNAISSALWETFSLPTRTVGCITAVVVLWIISGGIRSISRLSAVLVPVMAAGYVAACLIVVAVHMDALPGALADMLRCALSPAAFAGGMAGTAFRYGVSRGVLTHEAGLGSAAITAACSDDGDPLRQGYIAMTAVAFDTFLICTVTGLAICCSGALGTVDSAGQPLTGAALTLAAFETVFGQKGTVLLSISIVLFAFSSILGWAYQGEVAFRFLCGRRLVPLFRLLMATAALYGAAAELEAVFAIADICNALMCYPNLMATLLLSGVVAKEVRKR